MSADIKLTADHDLLLYSGDIVLVDGAARIAQQIKVTLLTWYGEYFLDNTFGVPYLESIMVKAPNRADIEWILRQRILDVPGVDRVDAMSIQYDNQTRNMQVKFSATTQEGIVADTLTLGSKNGIRNN